MSQFRVRYGYEGNATPNEESKKALERFRENFVTIQNDDGAWTTKQNQPPLVDGHDVMSMLIVVAAGKDQTGRLAREGSSVAGPSSGQRRARPWLSASWSPSNAKEKTHRLDQLRKQQREDGGWSQTKDLPSDALATGQVLYSLAAAGVTADDGAIRQGCEYLAKTQQPDGSWLVHTRNKNGHDPIISYYGSGWATLGLLRTLPQGK